MSVQKPPLAESLQATLMEVLGRQRLEHSPLLLAVSGGADSMALMHLAASSLPREQLKIAHLDHALRPESRDEAQWLQERCSDLALAFTSTRIDVARIAKQRGWNIEDAARRLRYPFLHREAKAFGAAAILTAHHLNDHIETMLLQILRGTAFVTGMAERQGFVLRPFLSVGAAQLQSYVDGQGIGYCQDASNFDSSYSRAFLRHEVVPKILERFPSGLERMHSLAEVQQRLKLEQQSQTQDFLALHTELRGLDRASFESLSIAHKEAVLVALMGENNGRKQVQEVLDLLRQDLPHKRKGLKQGLTLEINDRFISIAPPSQALSPEPYQAAKHQTLLAKWLDLETLPKHLLVLRSAQAADSIALSYGRKKISDLFQEHKIPLAKRPSIRVLAKGSEVFWVEGIATAAAYGLAAKGSHYFMRLALEEAKQAFAKGEVPVGAVVVREGEVIAKAHNLCEGSFDASAHAEMLAMRAASDRLESWRLHDCTLYVSLEPCPMCFGAMLQAQLTRVVYAAPNPREGALGGRVDLQLHAWKQQLQVERLVLAKESTKLLQAFFRQRRKKAS